MRFIENFIQILFVISLIVGYFAPTIWAIRNRKRNSTAIIALNIVAGWTFVGWVVAYVWALTKD